MRRTALFLTVLSVVATAFLGAGAGSISAATPACKAGKEKVGTRTCKGTATLKIGTSVRHFKDVSCLIFKVSDAPEQVFAKKGFALTAPFVRRARQSSGASILTYGPKGLIDEPVKVKLAANRRSGSFTGKTPKLSGSFTCK